MKKTFKTMALMVLSACIGVVVLMGTVMLDWSDNACIALAFAAAIVSGLVMGVYDVEEKRQGGRDSIRPQRRDYGQAAVFVGTACLLIGTPQECDDIVDDLWHHGQQARVEMLTGEETQFDVM